MAMQDEFLIVTSLAFLGVVALLLGCVLAAVKLATRFSPDWLTFLPAWMRWPPPEPPLEPGLVTLEPGLVTLPPDATLEPAPGPDAAEFCTLPRPAGRCAGQKPKSAKGRQYFYYAPASKTCMSYTDYACPGEKSANSFATKQACLVAAKACGAAAKPTRRPNVPKPIPF